ncbi:MAG TPA: T9SS type A sorting domain-containing protein [Flavobacterium sp.]|nr:T9SS type A sorting domain-containing protein [Flavobacterium sp.]
MKKILILVLLFSGYIQAQIVNIPDASFKAKLLSSNSFNTIAYGNGGYIKIDQNDDGEIQIAEAMVIDSLNVPFSNIVDFSGISDFTNLKKINCSNNQINNLNVTNLSLLQELYCSNNCMGTLSVNGLSNLKILEANTICVSNFNLTGLTSLEYFSCTYNGLSSLDVSQLTALKILNCGYNNLVSLTISGFPDLEQLICESNQSMSSFNISSLPSLAFLDVSVTNIGNLNLTSFTSLTNVVCTLANLNTLQVSNLPNLISLLCAGNSLSNLDLGSMPELQVLQCGGNLFTTLNLSETPNINRIECSSSLIPYLDLSNLTNLYDFSSYSGQFEELDFSSNPNLSSLILNTNTELKRLSLKNGTIQYFNGNGLIGCTNLEFICVDENEISQIQNFINASNLTNVSISSYCSFTPGGNYNTVTGNVRLDNNNNGCDEFDFSFPFFRLAVDLNAVSTNSSVFSNNNGVYHLYTTTEGEYALTPVLENPSYFTVSPEPGIAIIQEIDNSTTTLDFCITANGIHPDLEIVIAPVTPARPGFEAEYLIVYKNKGNQILSQQYGVNFFYNQNLMQLVSTSVLPSAQSPGGLQWDYANLMPFESRSIVVTMSINPPTDPENPVNINDVLTFASVILPQEGDDIVQDNTFVYNQTVVGSYDPNDITCLQGDVVSPVEIGNYLHYIVRFENTGTAPAENIVVKVEIEPNQFDYNSLQVLATSNDASVRMNANVIEFIFQNIQLESGGHGNILLKMKTNGTLQTGDYVEKRANIYFDYNFPIETNEAVTLFQALSVVNPVLDNLISIYPNPVKDSVNISIKENSTIKTIELYDIQGRLLQTKLVNDVISEINLAERANGMYFIKINTDKGSKVEKLVKE